MRERDGKYRPSAVFMKNSTKSLNESRLIHENNTKIIKTNKINKLKQKPIASTIYHNPEQQYPKPARHILR